MSAIDTRVSHASAAGFATKLSSTLNVWLNARATRKALNRLSDRELDDIGLTRGDIDRIANAY